jgi:hypothetical protein
VIAILGKAEAYKINVFSGPDTKNVKVNIPSSKWMMKMYMSTTPLYNMPLDLTGLLPLGKEVKVGKKSDFEDLCIHFRLID